MTQEAQQAMAALQRRIAGDGPIQKQIILLKLSAILENAPDFSGNGSVPIPSPQQDWLSAVGALLRRLDRVRHGARFDGTLTMILQHRVFAIDSIKRQVVDAIEELKLELELDGRDNIGSAYTPGSYYDYFRDLREILEAASQSVVIVDPYFDGGAFDAYLSGVRDIEVRILAQRYINDAKRYSDRHAAQHGTRIELRSSEELHDRLIFIDGGDCWITGGSIKDAGKKAAFLIPAQPAIAAAKLEIYSDVWARATPV